jgi:cation diffusion facilitator CzcD-associated flavoprotein CzcO
MKTHAVVIIGSGFSGLGMAIALRRAGIRDFVLLEKAGDVGGTWRDNTYPGCACDVQSHLYSFSFAPNPRWSRSYAPQPEILDYLRDCARRYGVLPHVHFHQEVRCARFDDTDDTWTITTADRSYRARVLVSGMGGLSTPAFPHIAGLADFPGAQFHSQQWAHGVDLRGKRVAVIGTGASAIQFVPKIAPDVARLDLYQRTPPWIVPRDDRAIGPRRQALFGRLPVTQRLARAAIYWQLEARALGFAVDPRVLALGERVARGHLARQVADPELRRKLTPDYRLGCKRVLISSDYYPALTRPNVEVITEAIAGVRGDAVVTADGKARTADVIILGTGFRATAPIPPGLIFGVGGRDLADRWVDGPEAYKGTTVAGFPNLFLLVGPNCGLAHSSMVYMIESQITYVMDALRVMRARRATRIDVRPDVEAAYNRDLQARLGRTVWSAGGCRSWYLHDSGKNVALWPGFTWQFRRMLRRFDSDAFELSPAARVFLAPAGPVVPTSPQWRRSSGPP